MPHRSTPHGVRVVQKGAGGLELENVQVSKVTNGTWLQLVRSCTLSTVRLVPDFKLQSSWESSRYLRVAHRGVEIRGYCLL